MTSLQLVLVLLGSNVLAAVVGSCIALIGVRIQNNANWKRHLAEVEEKSAERKRERKTELFLAASESITKMHEYLLAFGNFELDGAKRNELIQSSMGPINKALIIADQRSVEAILKLQERFAVLSLDLMEAREFADSQLKGAEISTSELQFARDAFVAGLQNGSSGASALNVELQAVLKETQLDREVQRKARIEVTNLFKKSMDTANNFEEDMAEAYVAIRNEIGFEIDEVIYRNRIRQSAQLIRDKLSDVLDRTLKSIDENLNT